MNITIRMAIPLLALLLGTLAHADTPEQQAERAALRWLATLDRGQYEQSWRNASPLVRRQVSMERWAQAVGAARNPLGKVRSRAHLTATYREHIPGAPDGKFVILRFDTAFENKRGAIETVTEMLVGNQWMTVAYFIQ